MNTQATTENEALEEFFRYMAVLPPFMDDLRTSQERRLTDAVQVGAPIQMRLPKTAHFYDDLRAPEPTTNEGAFSAPLSGKSSMHDFLVTLPFDDLRATPAAKTNDPRAAALEAVMRRAYNGPTKAGLRRCRNHRS